MGRGQPGPVFHNTGIQPNNQKLRKKNTLRHAGRKKGCFFYDLEVENAFLTMIQHNKNSKYNYINGPNIHRAKHTEIKKGTINCKKFYFLCLKKGLEVLLV